MSKALATRLARLETTSGSAPGDFRFHQIIYRQGDEAAKAAAYDALRNSGTFDERRDVVIHRVIISPTALPSRPGLCGRGA